MIKTSIQDDHCYFLALPQKDIKPSKGMLTPNESPEDEDLFETQAAASANPNNSKNIKFKFRIKFKSAQAKKCEKYGTDNTRIAILIV